MFVKKRTRGVKYKIEPCVTSPQTRHAVFRLHLCGRTSSHDLPAWTRSKIWGRRNSPSLWRMPRIPGVVGFTWVMSRIALVRVPIWLLQRPATGRREDPRRLDLCWAYILWDSVGHDATRPFCFGHFVALAKALHGLDFCDSTHTADSRAWVF